MDQSHERRKLDKYPPEIKEWIYAAGREGAQEAIVQLGFEVSRFGIKKAVYAIGAALVGLLSAVTYWFIHGGAPPR